MDQNATPSSSSIEGSLEPVSNVSETLASQPQEVLTTTGAQAKVPTLEASDLFGSLTNEQLLTLLFSAGVLIVIGAWFLDNARERVSDQIERLVHWWKWGKKEEDDSFHLFGRRTPTVAAKIRLTPIRKTASLDVPVSTVGEQDALLEPELGYENSPPADQLERAEFDVSELESKSASLEELTKSLQEKLEAAQSDLDSQTEQNQVIASKLTESQDETRQLQKWLDAERDAVKSEIIQVGSLTQQLADKNRDLEKAQLALQDATQSAAEQVSSLSEQAEQRSQKLAEELAQAREAQNQTQTESTDAKQQLDLLAQEHAKERALDNQRTETLKKSVADQAAQIEELQASLSKTSSSLSDASSEADQRAAALEDSNLRCQKLADELDALKHADEKSNSDLAEARRTIESLTLKASRAENDLEIANQEVIEKATLADRFLEESTVLRSSLVKLENQVNGADAKRASENQKIEALKKNVAEQTNHVETLQASLSKATSNADQNAKALEDSNSRVQKLTDELDALKQVDEKSASDLAEAKNEIETLALKVTRGENDLATANEKALEKATLADRLQEESTELKSALVKLENQLADTASQRSSENQQVETLKKSEAEQAKQLADQATQIESLQASLSEATSKADQNVAALEDSNSRYQKLTNELISLKQSDEKSNSHLADARKSIEALTLKVTHAENDLQTANQETLEKATLADRLLEESTKLKSALKKLEVQSADAEAKAAKLSKVNEDIQAQLQVEIDLREQATKDLDTALASHESEIAAPQEEVAELKSELAKLADDSRLKLTEALNRLSQEQTLHNKLKEVAKRDSEELSSQTSRFLEHKSKLASLQQHAEKSDLELTATAQQLEREKLALAEMKENDQKRTDEMAALVSKNEELQNSLKPLQQQTEKAQQDLAETLKLLENERSTHLELQNASEQLSVQLSQKDSLCSQLEIQLQEIAQSNAENSSSTSAQLERQGIELNELRLAAQNQQELQATTLQKLEASQERVAKLESAGGTSEVNKENYNKLAKKLIKYKKAYREIKVLVDGLATQKSEMSDLATEYLSMAKKSRRELDQQIQTNRELESKLEEALSSKVDESELQRLVNQRAQVYVLDLKSQFEQKLKEKTISFEKMKNAK